MHRPIPRRTCSQIWGKLVQVNLLNLRNPVCSTKSLLSLVTLAVSDSISIIPERMEQRQDQVHSAHHIASWGIPAAVKTSLPFFREGTQPPATALSACGCSSPDQATHTVLPSSAHSPNSPLQRNPTHVGLTVPWILMLHPILHQLTAACL